MSFRVADEMDVVRFLAEEYDPWIHDKRDEPPELDDDDYEVTVDDPNDGYARAVFDPNSREWLDV